MFCTRQIMMVVCVGVVSLVYAVEADPVALNKSNDINYITKIDNNATIHALNNNSIREINKEIAKENEIMKNKVDDGSSSEKISKKKRKNQLKKQRLNLYKEYKKQVKKSLKKRRSRNSSKNRKRKRFLKKRKLRNSSKIRDYKKFSKKRKCLRNRSNKKCSKNITVSSSDLSDPNKPSSRKKSLNKIQKLKLKKIKKTKRKKLRIISKLSMPQRLSRKYKIGRRDFKNKGRIHPFNSKKNLRDGRRKRRRIKCNRSTEISCPFKCISSNRICDGVVDCIDGSDEKNCKELKIGLYGGKRKGEGRVEITMNGFKGSVCSKGWTDVDALVYCRMLGYENGAKAVSAGKENFGLGEGLVWSTIFNCNGSEKDLFKCPLSKNKSFCSHRFDAGVVCNTAIKASKDSSQQCGVKSIMHPLLKVLGGQTATYGSQPWQARLVVKQGLAHLCGASIIDEQWIITAAHCLKKVKHDKIAVVLGDHNLLKKDGKEQVFSIDKVFVHPMFTKNNQETEMSDFFFDDSLFFVYPFRGRSYLHSRATASSFKHDIALLKIKAFNERKKKFRKIKFNKHVQPICLPDATTPYKHGQKCEVAGWGYSGRNKKTSMKLQVAKLSLIGKEMCEKSFVPVFFKKLPSEMVCAGSVVGNADTCQGDSGGPLACKVNGVYTLMGVTSWGYECGENVAPGIYTKVGALRDWIDETKNKN